MCSLTVLMTYCLQYLIHVGYRAGSAGRFTMSRTHTVGTWTRIDTCTLVLGQKKCVFRQHGLKNKGMYPVG